MDVTELEKTHDGDETADLDREVVAAAEVVLAETREELWGELKGFYKELAGFDPDPVKMLKTGNMLAEAFGPNSISMDPGVKEQIIEAVRTGRPIVFCPNHIRAEDQYFLIAALLAQQEKEFAAIIEHLRIMFKVEYAEGKDNQAIGFGPEQLIPLGGLPVVRPTRDDEVAKMAIEPFNDMIDELSERENYFIGFYESTRNQSAVRILFKRFVRVPDILPCGQQSLICQSASIEKIQFLSLMCSLFLLVLVIFYPPTRVLLRRIFILVLRLRLNLAKRKMVSKTKNYLRMRKGLLSYLLSTSKTRCKMLSINHFRSNIMMLFNIPAKMS